MSSIVSELTTGLTSEVLVGVIADLVPFIIILVPISLGLYFLRKLVKGAAKGKVRF